MKNTVSPFFAQIQLKHDERYLSAYLCLRAWHDVAAFLRVTVNFTLTLQDGPELLHSATAKVCIAGRLLPLSFAPKPPAHSLSKAPRSSLHSKAPRALPSQSLTVVISSEHLRRAERWMGLE